MVLNEGKIREPLTSTKLDGKFSLSLHFDSYARIDLHSSSRLEHPIRVEIALIKEKCEQFYKQTNVISPSDGFPVLLLADMNRSILRPENFVTKEMTISCKIQKLNRKQLIRQTTTDRCLDKTAISDNNQHVILHQLEEMFEKMVLSDVTFNIRGRTFAAHKTILAMRSPVFAAMFQHPTKEAESNQVEVEDIDPDVFQEILHFIYTGRTQSTTMYKMAPGLLAAADKYLLDDLKTRCETHLIRQMSAENCLEFLLLAIDHPADHLTECAVEFFRKYPGDVMKTDHWKKVKEENPAVFCEIQQFVFSTASTV